MSHRHRTTLLVPFLLAACGARSALDLPDDNVGVPASSAGAPAARAGAPSTTDARAGAPSSAGSTSSGGFGGLASGGMAGVAAAAGERETGDEPGAGGSGGQPLVDPARAGGLALGAHHTCARFDDGTVRCWGSPPGSGNAGAGSIGDDEPASSAGDLALGGKVVQLAASWFHTCARLDTGTIRCWGWGGKAELGYGNTETVGDDESPAVAGDVRVGGTVSHVSTGHHHTCASLDDGAVRCWGSNNWGQLGYADRDVLIGDDESPAQVPPVDVGGFVLQVAPGHGFTCALLVGGKVRCWGAGEVGLGYGNTEDVGDDETPAQAGDVELGGNAVQIVAGFAHSCALLDTGRVRCWGKGSHGVLGYGNTEDIGDDETPAEVGDIDIGGAVTQIAAGERATCAVLATGTVRCWGKGSDGELGYGNTENIGDNETPAAAGDVDVGGLVASIDVGLNHTCAALQSGKVRCWGQASGGRLGYANRESIGDDETPASAGDVPTH